MEDYYVRMSKSYDFDGEVCCEKYITTVSDDGVEWVTDSTSAEPVFPIGNVSAVTDDVIANNVSWEEASELIRK